MERKGWIGLGHTLVRRRPAFNGALANQIAAHAGNTPVDADRQRRARHVPLVTQHASDSHFLSGIQRDRRRNLRAGILGIGKDFPLPRFAPEVRA